MDPPVDNADGGSPAPACSEHQYASRRAAPARYRRECRGCPGSACRHLFRHEHASGDVAATDTRHGAHHGAPRPACDCQGSRGCEAPACRHLFRRGHASVDGARRLASRRAPAGPRLAGSRVLTPDQTWARLRGCCREGTPTSSVPSSDVRDGRRPEFTQWPAPVRRGCEAMQATGLTRPFSRPHPAGRARRAAGRRWRVGVERCEPGGGTPSPGARRASPSAGAPGACGTAPDRVAPRVRSRWGRPVGRVRPAPVGGAGLGGWFGQGS